MIAEYKRRERMTKRCPQKRANGGRLEQSIPCQDLIISTNLLNIIKEVVNLIEDFKPIPNFEDYLINEYGVVISKKTRKPAHLKTI